MQAIQAINKDNQLHISNLKGTKLDGLRALGTNTLSNNFCIKMNNPQAKVKTIKSDISNNKNLENYVKICNFNKHTTFALWTKRKDIIKYIIIPFLIMVSFHNCHEYGLLILRSFASGYGPFIPECLQKSHTGRNTKPEMPL